MCLFIKLFFVFIIAFPNAPPYGCWRVITTGGAGLSISMLGYKVNSHCNWAYNIPLAVFVTAFGRSDFGKGQDYSQSNTPRKTQPFCRESSPHFLNDYVPSMADPSPEMPVDLVSQIDSASHRENPGLSLAVEAARWQGMDAVVERVLGLHRITTLGSCCKKDQVLRF